MARTPLSGPYLSQFCLLRDLMNRKDAVPDAEADLQTGEGHAIGPVRVRLVGRAGVLAEDAQEGAAAVLRDFLQQLLRNLHLHLIIPVLRGKAR